MPRCPQRLRRQPGRRRGRSGGPGAGADRPSTIQQWPGRRPTSQHRPGLQPPGVRPIHVSARRRQRGCTCLGKLSGDDDWRGNLGLRLREARARSVTTNTGLSCGAAGSTGSGRHRHHLRQRGCRPSACKRPSCPPAPRLTTGSRFGNFFIDDAPTASGSEAAAQRQRECLTSASKLTAARGRRPRPCRAPSTARWARRISATLPVQPRRPRRCPPQRVAMPTLKPVVAKNYNLGVEWYFQRAARCCRRRPSSIDFDSLIGAGSSVQYLFNTASQGPWSPACSSPPVMDTTGQLSRSRLPRASSQAVWSWAGSSRCGAASAPTANYTFADAKEANGNPMHGCLPSHTYNLGAYYEDDRLQRAHRLRAPQRDRASACTALSAELRWRLQRHGERVLRPTTSCQRHGLSLNVEGLNLNKPDADATSTTRAHANACAARCRPRRSTTAAARSTWALRLQVLMLCAGAAVGASGRRRRLFCLLRFGAFHPMAAGATDALIESALALMPMPSQPVLLLGYALNPYSMTRFTVCGNNDFLLERPARAPVALRRPSLLPRDAPAVGGPPAQAQGHGLELRSRPTSPGTCTSRSPARSDFDRRAGPAGLRAAGGVAWVCTSSCGPGPISAPNGSLAACLPGCWLTREMALRCMPSALPRRRWTRFLRLHCCHPCSRRCRSGQGGPVIAMQVENEYGSYGSDQDLSAPGLEAQPCARRGVRHAAVHVRRRDGLHAHSRHRAPCAQDGQLRLASCGRSSPSCVSTSPERAADVHGVLVRLVRPLG